MIHIIRQKAEPKQMRQMLEALGIYIKLAIDVGSVRSGRIPQLLNYGNPPRTHRQPAIASQPTYIFADAQLSQFLAVAFASTSPQDNLGSQRNRLCCARSSGQGLQVCLL